MASDHATTRYPAIWPRPSTLNADGQSWNNRPGPPSVVPQILPLKRLLDEMDSDLAFISSYPTVSDREFKMTDFQIDKKAYDDGAEISRAGPPADASSSNGPKFAVFRNMAMKEYLASQRHTPAKDHSAWLVAAIRTCQHTGKAVLALHPAEASGPSKNPRLQLMCLPREIRDKIFHRVLLVDKAIPIRFWKRVTGNIFSLVSSYHCVLEQTCNYGCMLVADTNLTRTMCNVSNARKSKLNDSTCLLFVCKQTYEEGREIFYSENQFRFVKSSDPWSSPVFQDLSNAGTLLGLSTSSASLIRRIVIDLEALVLALVDARLLLDPMILVLCHWLPRLQCLRLTLEIGGRDSSWRLRKGSSGCEFSAEARASMLTIAALVAQNHPVLDKIVLETGTDRIWFPGYLSGCLAHKASIGSGFYVEVVPATQDTPITHTRLGADGNEFEIKNVALDREKILQMAWEELGEHPVSHYIPSGQ